MKKLLCWLLGHRYKISREITKDVQELVCTRCGAEFGVHHGLKMILPLDDSLRSGHKIIEDSAKRCARHSNKQNVSNSLNDTTLAEIEKAVKKLKQARPPEVTPLAAGDYPDLSDEMFKWMMTCKGVQFVGSIEDGEKMIARCKKLGIEVADPVEAKWPFPPL